MRLTRQTLGEWTERTAAVDPLPPLTVLRDGRDVLGATLPSIHELPLQTIHDPGCYQFFLEQQSSDFPFDTSDGNLLSTVARQVLEAGGEYGREIGIDLDASVGPELSEQSEPTKLFGQPPQIRLNDGRPIPSVGPGGYVTLGRRDRTITGTSSVRPFVEQDDVWPWLDTDSVLAALAGLLDADLEVDPIFGYYERTWMERQEVIEPVYAFLVEDRGSSEYPSKWEITVPATVQR